MYFLITVGMLIVVSTVTAITGRMGELASRGKAKVFSLVTNTTYKNECGSCHMAYQPDLLPAKSWSRMLEELPSHFKRAVVLTPKMLDSITSYLKDNAAENSDAVRAKKISEHHGRLAVQNIRSPLYSRETSLHRKQRVRAKISTFPRQLFGLS